MLILLCLLPELMLCALARTICHLLRDTFSHCSYQRVRLLQYSGEDQKCCLSYVLSAQALQLIIAPTFNETFAKVFSAWGDVVQ